MFYLYLVVFVTIKERSKDWMSMRDWISDISFFTKQSVLGSVAYFHVVTTFFATNFFSITSTGLYIRQEK